MRNDLDLSPIVERHGTWAVTTYGVECTTRYYPIEKSRLNEDWLYHMGNKTWLVWQDFAQAFCAALEYHQPNILREQRAKPVPAKQRYRILLRDGFTCQLCGADKSDGVKLHVDHRIPRAKGGDSGDGNLWTLCQNCNLGKSDDF